LGETFGTPPDLWRGVPIWSKLAREATTSTLIAPIARWTMPPKQLSFVGGFTRQIDNPNDNVSAKRTRTQVANMSDGQYAEFRAHQNREMDNARIKPKKNGKGSIRDYMDKESPVQEPKYTPGEPGPSSVPTPTTQASPKMNLRKRHKGPETPEGLSPWSRNGVNAALQLSPEAAPSQWLQELAKE
jgi:hypothetical protein